MTLAATLWESNSDLACAALEHPFVRGLSSGSLPLERFQSYIAQDAFFLDAFVRAYALALARCPDHEGLHVFYNLLSGALEELKLHAGYAARWRVNLRDVAPLPATLAYTDFLLATAALAGVGEICAAMTPCMRLYAFLGQQLARDAVRDDNPYAEWIRNYADPGVQTLTVRLESQLDRYAADTQAVRSAYRRAMRLEVAFFSAHMAAQGDTASGATMQDSQTAAG